MTKNNQMIKTELVNIKRLKNNTGQVLGLPKNPRFIKDEKFKKLVKSITDDPEMMQLREVIAYDNNGELVVIAGNMRLRACLEIGIKEIPCKILPNNTPIEKLKAYTIKDNVSFGSDDFDLLANEWDVDLLLDFGVSVLPTFNEEEIDLMKQHTDSAEKYLNNMVRQILLVYDVDTHKVIVEKLKVIGENHGISEDNSAVVLKLIEHYEGN